MADSNIERFDEITGKIFAHLYQQFPIPTHLNSEIVGIVISGTVTVPYGGKPYGGIHDLSDSDKSTVNYFVHSARWLAKAGYIDISFDGGASFSDVTLTAKGLEVLKATPKSLENSESIGQQLITAAKGGFGEQIRDLTSSALKRGIALAVTTATELAAS